MVGEHESVWSIEFLKVVGLLVMGSFTVLGVFAYGVVPIHHDFSVCVFKFIYLYI